MMVALPPVAADWVSWDCEGEVVRCDGAEGQCPRQFEGVLFMTRTDDTD